MHQQNAFDMLPVIIDRAVFKVDDCSACLSVLGGCYYAFTGLRCVLALTSQFLQLLGLWALPMFWCHTLVWQCRTSRKRQHTMPGLAIVAAVAAAAQKGGAFWGTVKSLLPQVNSPSCVLRLSHFRSDQIHVPKDACICLKHACIVVHHAGVATSQSSVCNST